MDDGLMSDDLGMDAFELAVELCLETDWDVSAEFVRLAPDGAVSFDINCPSDPMIDDWNETGRDE